MKYVITSMFVDPRGGVIFNPSVDVEIFDTYVGALRWLVGERKLAKRIDSRIVCDWNIKPNQYGRERLFEMTECHGASHTIVTLARINENGFH